MTALHTTPPTLMSRSSIESFFEKLAAHNPHPRIELEYTNAFELLVAVVLSAQATDKQVNIITHRLFPVANTPQQMLELGHDGVLGYVRSINYCNNKTKNLIRLSEQLIERHGGAVPNNRTELEALAGVGRKSANVILNVIHGEPTIAVDTHIYRVAHRTGLATGATPRAVEDMLLKVVPKRFRALAHHWLVLHGRYICQAKRPRCAICPVIKECQYTAKALQIQNPNPNR